MDSWSGKLCYTETEEEISISSPYWTVSHLRKYSGALSRLSFMYGSGKNLLASPLNSYFRRKEGSEYQYYEEIFSLLHDMRVNQNPDGIIRVTTRGKYASAEKNEICASYERSYFYNDFGLVDISLKIHCEREIKDIIEIGIAGLSVIGSLDYFGYRPAPELDPSPAYSGHCIWHHLTESQRYDAVPQIGRYLPVYLCMIDRGVEGLELFRGDDLENEAMAFTPGENGKSYCGVRYDSTKEIVTLRYEPYSNWTVPITISSGLYTFYFSLGLPFSKGKEKVNPPYFHVGFQPYDGTKSAWPDEKRLDLLADSGIKVLRLHDDYFEGGPFWHDGQYPPYDPENMEALDRTIEQVHTRGMKIVPYFSLKELHPICPEYIQYAEDWKRTVDSKGSIIHNYVGSGEFGAQMCLRSGWLDFRKASIDLVLSKHNFDGVYYDWVSALYCNNPQHLEGKKHNDVRELLDLIFWTRKRVGPNGLVFLHLSGVPMMVIENVTDFVFTHEELNMLAPGPGEFSPETDFAGITTHHIVESKATDTLEKKIRFAIGCFLEGFWITPAVSISAEDLSFQMTKKLTQYDITTYSFIPAREKPVWIKGDGLMASFYWKKGKAIIHLANLGHQSSDSLFGIDLRDKGFSAGATIEVFSDGKVVFNTDLTTFAENGIPVRVDPLQTLFFEIWEK